MIKIHFKVNTFSMVCELTKCLNYRTLAENVFIEQVDVMSKKVQIDEQLLQQVFADGQALPATLAGGEMQYLLKALYPLQYVDATYPKRALDYVLHGAGSELLLELQQSTNEEILRLMWRLGDYYHSYWNYYNDNNKTKEKIVQHAYEQRGQFYRHIFQVLTAEQIVRLGKLWHAINREQDIKSLNADVPLWFDYLLTEMFIVARDDEGHYLQNQTVQQLLEILQADDVENAVDVLIKALFDRKDVPEYYADELNVMFDLSDSVAFLQQHLDILENVIPQITILGKRQFLNGFVHRYNDFVQHCPQLMANLVVDSSKTIRELAVQYASHIDVLTLQPFLKQILQTGNSKQRGFAVEMLARGGDVNREILQDALASEKLKSVQQAIELALQRLATVVDTPENKVFDFPPVADYQFSEIPLSFAPVILENYQEFLEQARISAEQEREENKTSNYKSRYAQNKYKDLLKMAKTFDAEQIIQGMNQRDKSLLEQYYIIEIINFKKKIQQLPEYGIHYAFLFDAMKGNQRLGMYNIENYGSMQALSELDLRQLEQIMTWAGYEKPSRIIAEQFLESYDYTLAKYIRRDELIVPFFAEHLEFLQEGLGVLPSQSEYRWRSFEPIKTIEVLRKFPSLPQIFVGTLLEMALGEQKSLRVDSQNLLAQHVDNIHERAIEALQHSKQEIRVTAIEWLARLQHQDAIKPLYALLKKEKKEIVIASILTALEQLGEDIQPYLSPEQLLKDAEKGLSAKLQSSFTWFNADILPDCVWQNGETVDRKIIHWWVVLAEKLKEPTANALLQRYLGLLDVKSQQNLGLNLLQCFITQDIRTVTLDDAIAYAEQHAPARLQDYRDWYDNWAHKYDYYQHYGTMTLEEVKEEIKREKLGEYLGSAIKSKGILALVNQAQGVPVVRLLQDFMKNHYRRTSQITALLSAFASSDDPVIIQLLLSVSRRYRTSSIQELAKTLIEEIAERNHWTADELADRTIPTAGLDEHGTLQLEYGSRILTAYVDDKDKFVLKNEEGKVIKSLPTARQGDDETLIKEAKAQFSNSKKEYKQVVDLQTARLYEAMCSQREWQSSDWQQYLFAHPIMKRLITRLVWLEKDQHGKVLHQFRPSDDGCLLNTDDDEIQLQEDSVIQLAHAVLLDAEQLDAWLAHFKDYDVKPLFSQLQHSLPSFANDETLINDRKGWLTDTFTLRGVLNKLGYQRASIEDGGSFDRYFKAFPSVGLSAVITFSGSYVPEENITAVLYELCFENSSVQSYSWNSSYAELKNIPSVLLAEAYADYLKVADACQGFDPEWEKKTPW